ncbi:MAG TPA: hypothetical protein VJ831_10440, partial [Jatrophihabitantaceae bacterium]|nr:hypothetical protein [Jatrophihabitantaceae bacterium]
MVEPDWRITEVDGVPTYWAPTETETVRASLWFRGGTADLLLPHHGWLHLLEHLALHNPQFRDMTVNGEVGLRYTRFDVAGLANEVALFLRRVCEWLTSPSFEDLEHELRVLRAESQQRSIGSVARHLVWRYGANGP